jgi:hypothetical protein
MHQQTLRAQSLQKGFDQIKDIPKSFVASDGIEIGSENKIPLWLFGFL